MKPILTFEFILDGVLQSYQTDGDSFLGPNKMAITNLKKPITENMIQLSYLVNEDPDMGAKLWYQKVCSYEFKTEAEFKDALADVIQMYRSIYKYITKEFPYENYIDPVAAKFGGYPTINELREKLSAL